MSCQKCGSTDTYCGCDEATAIAERDAALAELASLKKRIADAERGIVEHYQDQYGDHLPCVVCDYPAGVKVALVRLEDGE